MSLIGSEKSGNTFNDVLVRNSEKHISKKALIQINRFGEEVYSINYSNLINASILFSNQLSSHFNKGDRCIISIPPGVEYVVAFLGCLFSGIIAVPVAVPRRKKTNKRFWSILSDSSPKGIITNQTTYTILHEILTTLPTSKLSENIITVTINNSHIKPEFPIDIHDNDIAFLQYTSGSVSDPKGVIINHKNLVHNSEIIKKSFNHTKELVGVNWLPPYHDMGLIGCLLQPLYVGGTAVIIQPYDFIRDPALWFHSIQKYKATTVGCPNFALDYCISKIQSLDAETMSLSSLKVMFCGSEPIRKSTFSRFTKKFAKLGFDESKFLPCYGLAEATLMVSGLSQEEVPIFNQLDTSGNKSKVDKTTYASCGKGWKNTVIRIVDLDAETILPDSEIGEIWVNNDSVSSGYWGTRDVSNDSFNGTLSDIPKKPFLKTGDIGFISDTNLYVIGRKREMIIINGLNIFPNDIEGEVHNCHEKLMANSCAVFSILDDEVEKVIIVQEIKRKYLAQFDFNDVYAKILSTITEVYEIPIHSIVLIKPYSLSKTSSGKIRRKETKRLYLEKNLAVVDMWKEVPKRNPEEIGLKDTDLVNKEIVVKWIKQWLGNKLRINSELIDPDQSVLGLGLDSIGAVELESDINTQFNMDLFVGDFLQDNSINKLAEDGLKTIKHE